MLNTLVFGGRHQGEGSSNGSLECAEVLLQAANDAGYSAQQCRVNFYPWWADGNDIAMRLHLQRLRYQLQRSQFGIVICGYSRGVGYGITRLTGWAPFWRRWLGKSGLQRFGLTVDSLVSCDGIYHHWFSVLGAQWRSVIGQYQIQLPSMGPTRVYEFRQVTSVPRGMDLVLTEPAYFAEPPQILEYEHTEMDNAPEYHAKCVEVMLDAAQRYVPSSRKDSSPAATTAATAPLTELESKLENTSTPTPEILKHD